MWETDPSATVLLAIAADFIRRYADVLDDATSGGPHGGVYVRSGDELQRNLAAARAGAGPDCRRDDTLPVQCLQTRGEAAFLQESLAWHLLAGWAHFVVLIDLDPQDRRWGHTLAALRPFVEAGAATVVRVVHRDAAAPEDSAPRVKVLQGDLGRLCLEAVHAGGCGLRHVPDAAAATGGGRGGGGGGAQLPPGTPHRLPERWGVADLPTTLNASLGWPICPPGEAAAGGETDGGSDDAWKERVWVSKLDDDEFVAPRGDAAGACVSDLLRWPAFLDAGGVCPPWLEFGGSDHVEHPRGEDPLRGGGLSLVSETYTRRAAGVREVGKAIARLPGLVGFEFGGLWPYYAPATTGPGGQPRRRPRPISGIGGTSCIFPAPAPPANATNATWPLVVTGHFYGRAVDRGLLKWARGRAGHGESALAGWPLLKNPSEVVGLQWGLPVRPDVTHAYPVDEQLSPRLSAQVRVALGLPPPRPPREPGQREGAAGAVGA